MDSSSFIPGTVSETLLEALGVTKGAPPPWQGRLHAFGVPFDFRSDVCRLRSPERYVEQSGREASDDLQDPLSASFPTPLMLETVNSDTAGSAQDAPTCDPGSREFLAGAANHSARLQQGTATQSAGEPLQGTTHPQARAAESGPSDGEALARVAQPVEECLVTSGNPESGREVESAEQKDITPDQASGDVRSARHAMPVKSPISEQPSSSQGTAEASVVDAGKTEEAEYSIKHGSRSESLGSEELLQRVRGSGSDILGLNVLLWCSSVQRLRGSGGDRGRRGGTSLNQGLDVTSHRRAAGRGRGSSAGRGMRCGHSSDLRGRGDLRQRRSVGGGFVRSAALDEAPSAASPGDHAGASAKASYLRDARSPMAQRPHPQSRPSGDRGMDLRGSISLAKPQIQSSGSPNDGIGAPSCQLPRSPRIAARTRTPETPPWNNRGAADTPPPEVQASRGMLPRRGLLSRLSRSPSPAPQAMYPSNCAARRPTHRRRAGLDRSISSTPTPDADHAGASPEDDPDDLWHMRSRTGTQVHASKGQSGAPSLVVQHVRAELAQVSGLDRVMAEQLEQQLVRGLEGIKGVDIAESARILVQRVASAVLQATRGVGDPTLSREYSGNLMDDAAAKQRRNIDSRAGARGHSLGAAAQKAVHDDCRGRGHERGKIRDAREGFGSRGATLPADSQSPGNPSKRLSECYMGGGPGRSGSTGLQEPRGCEGGVGTERSGVKRQSRNVVGEGLPHGVSSTIERVLAAPVEEQGECNGSNKRRERSSSAELDVGPRKQPKRTRPTRDELQQEQRRRESARRCEALGITAVSDDEDFRMPMDVTDTLEEEMGVDVHSPVGNRGGFVRPIEGHLSRKDGTEEEELLLMQASKRTARLRQDPGQVGMGDLLVKTLEERLGRKILDDMPAVMDFSAAIQPQRDTREQRAVPTFNGDASANHLPGLAMPKPVVIEIQGGSQRPERATSTLQDAWWHPRKDMSTLGPQYVSDFEYPGLNAPLAGKASQEHKRAWAQPEFVPQRLVDAVRQASHTRVKQFFSYRHNEQGLAVAALAMGAKKGGAQAKASAVVK